tara:strand:+ start:1454 stop:1795 length:342 start_codon:yes stop_codon:yes gene_type:complete
MANVSIKATKNDNTATVDYDFGDDVNAAVELFGADVVFAGFVKSATITAQANMRRHLEAGASDEDIQAKMADWKPGVVTRRTKDPVGAIKKKFGSMDAEAQKELIKHLKASLG